MTLVDNGVITDGHLSPHPLPGRAALSGYSVEDLQKHIGGGSVRQIGRLLKPLGFTGARKASTIRVKRPGQKTGKGRLVKIQTRWNPPAPNQWPDVFKAERDLLSVGKTPAQIQSAKRSGRIPGEILAQVAEEFHGRSYDLAKRGVLTRRLNEVVEQLRAQDKAQIAEWERRFRRLANNLDRDDDLRIIEDGEDPYREITWEELNVALGMPGGNTDNLLLRATALSTRLTETRELIGASRIS